MMLSIHPKDYLHAHVEVALLVYYDFLIVCREIMNVEKLLQILWPVFGDEQCDRADNSGEPGQAAKINISIMAT